MKGAGGTNTGNEWARDRSWRLTLAMREKPANCERLIARIAGRQHGVVSSGQLRAAGIDKSGISRRVRAGRLHRLHRGVYAVGHTRLSFEGCCLAAALACGQDAVVSHRSAAAVWRMLPPLAVPIDVTIPTDVGRESRGGITIHRSSTLIAGFVTRRSAVPVTRPARTLRDLHRAVPRAVHQRAVRRALDLRLITTPDLGAEPDLTRSELERLFLRLCRRHRFPSPEVNARVGSYEVDFLFRGASVIVETDGFRHHGNRVAFESDRARDAELQATGFRVLRFTYRQVRDESRSVAASLRPLLQGPLAA
jgi:very-short-patch-repair endonuclease